MYGRLTLIGFVGHDPELAYLDDGTLVANYSVAVNRQVQGRKCPMWLQVSSFGRRAELDHKYLGRGDKVFVEGRLQFDPETGGPRIHFGEDGHPHCHFQVYADQVIFLSEPDFHGQASPNGHKPVILVQDIP